MTPLLHLVAFYAVPFSGPITFMSIGAWFCWTHHGDWRLR